MLVSRRAQKTCCDGGASQYERQPRSTASASPSQNSVPEPAQLSSYIFRVTGR